MIGYTDALGMVTLRQRIRQHYADFYGVDVPLERIIVTTGSSGGFLLALIAAFDAGQSVALPSLGYPAYANIFKALGLNVRWLQTGPASRLAPTPEMLKEAARNSGVDGFLVASPANPSGTVVQPDQLEATVNSCASLDIRFISDEIYHGLTYDALAETALRYTDDAIIIKAFPSITA